MAILREEKYLPINLLKTYLPRKASSGADEFVLHLDSQVRTIFLPVLRFPSALPKVNTNYIDIALAIKDVRSISFSFKTPIPIIS